MTTRAIPKALQGLTDSANSAQMKRLLTRLEGDPETAAAARRFREDIERLDGAIETITSALEQARAGAGQSDEQAAVPSSTATKTGVSYNESKERYLDKATDRGDYYSRLADVIMRS